MDEDRKTERDPADVLAAYGAGQASTDDVMRALVSHRGWFVPIGFFAGCRGDGAKADSVLILSSESQAPPGNLWLFTDEGAARLAQSKGVSLGAYAGRMSGTELFGAVGGEHRTVYVNPGLPRERTWVFQEGSAAEVGGLWAEAVALEESFVGWQAAGAPDLDALEAYRAFMLYNFASGPVVTLPGRGGLSNPAAAFTAPDCAAAFLGLLSEEQRGQLRSVTIDGSSLLANLPSGIDGLLFNPFGPGATYALPLSAREVPQ